MVRYSLRCAEGHGFESWFASAAAFDALAGAGHLSCPDCGSPRVEKALMAPALGSAAAAPASPLAEPRNEREAMLAELRRKIEAESDYVGLSFAAEARAIHEGTAPARSIHGEARADEARALLEDGIPVAPLPFLPKGRAN
jgi:hypothetical protein